MADTGRIEVLSGLQAVRRRPALYVGTERPAEIAAGLCDELVRGATLEVPGDEPLHCGFRIETDEVLVCDDNGRGAAVRSGEVRGPTITSLFTAPPVCWHGRGSEFAVLTAFSTRVAVDAFRDGIHYRQEFAGQGGTYELVAATALETVGRADRQGTRIRFELDLSLLGGVGWPRDGASRLRGLDLCEAEV